MLYLVLIFCLSWSIWPQSTMANEFIFLTKFCFDTSGNGELTFTVNAGSQAPNLAIVLYDDQSGSWQATYGNPSLTCSQQVNNAKAVIPFTNGQQQNVTFTDHIRPHYWYAAVANCDGVTFELNYQFLFLQYQNNWNKQFSFDEQGLLLTYILFFITYVFFLSAHLYGDYQLIRGQSFHPIVQLLTLSIVAEFLSLFFFVIHYGSYVNNGMGSPACYTLAQICDILSVLLFMLLLILVSKGWGITFPTLSHIQSQKVLLAIILAVLFICYAVLFLWGIFWVDPAVVLYVYQSIPGVILLCVRFLTMVYFIWCLQKTVKEDNDSTKKSFYVVFGIGFSLWFLSLPFIVLMSLGLSGWYRAKAVVAITETVTALAYFGLGFLLWPSRASRYFTVSGPDVFKGSGYERL